MPIGLPVDRTTQQRQDWPAAPASLSSLHSSTACVIREVPFSRLGFLEGFEHMLLAVYFTCLPSAAFERTGFLNGSRCVARSDSESSLAKMTPSRAAHIVCLNFRVQFTAKKTTTRHACEMTVAVFVAYSWLSVEKPFATARFACAVEFWMI
jgi:hypothetical protein